MSEKKVEEDEETGCGKKNEKKSNLPIVAGH